MSEQPARALTIAGSDSGGGAGIQADLKTFAAFGVHGMSALTAITAQNTRGVLGVELVSPELVAEQIDAVVEDLGVDAVKTGMLGSAEIVATVAERIRTHGLQSRFVLDPVMVAKSGDRLLDPEAVGAVRERLLPLARCITPNLAEAAVLTDMSVGSLEEMGSAGQRLLELGAGAALVKGGHLDGDPVDLLCLPDGEIPIGGERVDTPHTHGTGCTLGAAITAGLARGQELEPAVRAAREYLQAALRAAPGLGSGHGPMWHQVRPPKLPRDSG